MSFNALHGPLFFEHLKRVLRCFRKVIKVEDCEVLLNGNEDLDGNLKGKLDRAKLSLKTLLEQYFRDSGINYEQIVLDLPSPPECLHFFTSLDLDITFQAFSEQFLSHLFESQDKFDSKDHQIKNLTENETSYIREFLLIITRDPYFQCLDYSGGPVVNFWIIRDNDVTALKFPPSVYSHIFGE